MRITEITNIEMKFGPEMDEIIDDEWNEVNPDYIKPVARLGGYTIQQEGNIGTEQGESWDGVTFWLLDNQNPVGYLQLYPFNKNKDIYEVSYVRLKQEATGKGLAVKLYKWAILDRKLTIVSDQSQTKGSKKLWLTLANDPELNVYGYRKGVQGQKDKFTAVDINDLGDLEGAFDIYDQPGDDLAFTKQPPEYYDEIENIKQAVKKGKISDQDVQSTLARLEVEYGIQHDELRQTQSNTHLVVTKA